MKFTTTFTNLMLAFSLSTSLVVAAPIGTRDVYVPPIVTPTQGEVWTIGQNRTVTWNTTSPAPPEQITNKLGKIMLRKGERTLMNIILAEKLDILSGSINVTVPDVDPGEDYRVVLFGDSGNWSPPFKIEAQPQKQGQ